MKAKTKEQVARVNFLSSSEFSLVQSKQWFTADDWAWINDSQLYQRKTSTNDAMSKETQQQIIDALEAHNEKQRAWANEKADRWCALCDPKERVADLLKYAKEVITFDDFERYEIWETYYELHRDVYGIKARWTKWTDHDLQGWKDALASLQSEVDNIMKGDSDEF